jgi:hypothetical protein
MALAPGHPIGFAENIFITKNPEVAKVPNSLIWLKHEALLSGKALNDE